MHPNPDCQQEICNLVSVRKLKEFTGDDPVPEHFGVIQCITCNQIWKYRRKGNLTQANVKSIAKVEDLFGPW